MCPDIETFAPLIHGDVRAGEVPRTTPTRRPSRGRRTCASGSPTARCARPTRCSASSPQLLELADARLTASQVLDLAGREPVRRRFRLDDDDLDRLEDWVAASRDPLGPRRRAPRAVPARRRRRPNTWRAGLDRLLLGVAMTEDEQRLVGGALPLDDVDSGDIDLAGRLAELVDRLGAALDALRAPQPIAALGRRRSPTPPTR